MRAVVRAVVSFNSGLGVVGQYSGMDLVFAGIPTAEKVLW